MIVVLLTLASAALSAVSAAGEHRVAARLARRSSGRSRSRTLRPIATAVALVATPLWLASWGVDAAGTVLQAAALQLGSLTIVQPLMVATLLFTLPLAAMGGRRRPTLRDWAGAGAIAVGLAMVLSTRSAPDAAASAPTGMLIPAMAAVSVIVVVLVALARNRTGSARAALLAVAAGALFAVGAAATKLTAGAAVNGGFAELLTTWPGYALAVVSVASFGLQQAAYAAGSLATVMTAAVITDPLTSYALGVVGFGESMPATGLALVVALVGMLTLAVGVATLAHSPLLLPHRHDAAPAPALARPAPAATGVVIPWPGRPVESGPMEGPRRPALRGVTSGGRSPVGAVAVPAACAS